MCEEQVSQRLYLFGGSAFVPPFPPFLPSRTNARRPWTTTPSPTPQQSTSFHAIDDRVRGGSSTSALLLRSADNTAVFEGELDTRTLGGAGFASQCSVDGLEWDLGEWDGVEVELGEGGMEGKRGVVVLKDRRDERRMDGRSVSGLTWEWVFSVRGGERVKARWEEFKPVYRGREVQMPEGGLKRGEIKRVGIMMRSFFDAQSGPFSIPIRSIAAVKLRPPSPSTTPSPLPAGIAALTDEMRKRGEGTGDWRGWVNWIGRV